MTHFHLYEESFEDDGVYLELEGEVVFEASSKHCTVKIPLEIWEKIRQDTHSIMRSEQAGKTDEELLEMATKYVRERLEEHKNGHPIAAMSGLFVFGDVEDPEEQQIARGFKSFKTVRDLVARVTDSEIKPSSSEPVPTIRSVIEDLEPLLKTGDGTIVAHAIEDLETLDENRS